jgi:heat shock protein HtpX
LALASALHKLEVGTAALPLQPQERLMATSSLMIANPFRKEGLSNLFSTHPPMAARIERLQNMARQS